MVEPSTSRRTARPRLIRFGVPALIVVAVVVVAVAWSRGAFESRVTYWLDRGRDCGHVIYGPNRALVDPGGTAPAVVSCFAATYARCEPATLARDVGGTDTGETDTFVVEPRDAGGCDVGLHYEFSIVGSSRTTTIETQCGAVTWDGTLLTFSHCGTLDSITVPAPQAT
jgi:hypothetical protein